MNTQPEDASTRAPQWPIDTSATLLASISVGSASLVLVILSVGAFPDLLQGVIALAGILLLFASGTIIDWYMDRFNGNAWAVIDKFREQVGEKPLLSNKTPFAKRRHVYAGGYIAVTAALSLLNLAISLTGFKETTMALKCGWLQDYEIPLEMIGLFGFVWSFLLSIEICVRLMTYKMVAEKFFKYIVVVPYFLVYVSLLIIAASYEAWIMIMKLLT